MGNSIKEATSIMKPKQIFISILAVLFVFPLMGTFAQQAPDSVSITVISTFAYQLNRSNQLVGYYIDSSGTLHGYFRDTNGALQFPIDPSGSTGTVLFGLND